MLSPVWERAFFLYPEKSLIKDVTSFAGCIFFFSSDRQFYLFCIGYHVQYVFYASCVFGDFPLLRHSIFYIFEWAQGNKV